MMCGLNVHLDSSKGERKKIIISFLIRRTTVFSTWTRSRIDVATTLFVLILFV